jgi:outer membrane protein assembly factor BamB
MDASTRIFSGALFILSLASIATSAEPNAPLGSPQFLPSPECPVGWRGDWTGRFAGALPPTTWSRRVKGVTTYLRYQAAKPAGEPGKDSRQLEYFTIKDWLVAGPFPAQDPLKDLDKDFIGGEAAAMPVEGAKVSDAAWKFIRADVDTQSRHDHNEGTCGQSFVDFIYAFGKLGDGPGVKVEGDFTNKIAYAHTYIHAPAEAKVQLQLPFEGTAGRFWLNGKPTDLDPKNRRKVFDVTLAQGWNRLLVKISAAEGLGKHYTGRWISQWMVAAYLNPVAPFSYETRNVTWMTKMTGRSMSQPIVVGDRVFVGSNISDLICISKKDGRVLWLHSTTPYDALTPEERAAIPELKEKVEPLIAQLEKQNQEAISAINAAVSPEGLSSDRVGVLDKILKDRTETEKKIHKAFSDIDRKKFPAYNANEVSSSNATPCSDGARVYWTCGGGMKGPGAHAIVCFDMEGKRLWTRHEVPGSLEHGNHQSPTLVDGKLIFGANTTLLALDAKTGAIVWKKEKFGDISSGISPIIARIGGEAVVITKQKVARVSDGEVICDSFLHCDISEVTPVVENGVIYNSSRFRDWKDFLSIIAVKLPPSTASNSKAQILWDPPGKDVNMPLRGGNFVIASPLVLDNVLYGIDMTGGLIAVDMQAQKSLYRRWLDGYNRFNRFLYGVTASPTQAGKFIYITDDAGYTHLIQPGPEFKEVGKNVLENISISGVGGNPCRQESFYTSPYFDNNSMYLRGEEYLYCISEKKTATR